MKRTRVLLLACLVSAGGCAGTQSAVPVIGAAPAGYASIGAGLISRPDVKQGNEGSPWVLVPVGLSQNDAQPLIQVGRHVLTLDKRKNLVTASMDGTFTSVKIADCSPTNAFDGIENFAVNRNGIYFFSGSQANPFPQGSNAVGIGIASSINCYTLPDNITGGMTEDSNGDEWAVAYTHYLKITPSGSVTSYPYPNAGNNSGGIALGPDNNMFMTQAGTSNVFKIRPSDGTILATYVTSTCSDTVAGIASVSGFLWIGCGRGIVKLSTSGGQTFYSANSNDFEGRLRYGVTAGADGNPWFIASSGIGTIDRHTGVDTIVPSPPNTQEPFAIAVGPDHNLWQLATYYPNGSVNLNVYVPHPLTVNPESVVLKVDQARTITIGEPGTHSWTAVSGNPAVATVSASGSPKKFTIRGVSSGHTSITVSDSAGNSAKVTVTVH